MQPPPADFQAAASDRLALWAELPDAMRAYISQLHARAEEGAALAELAWALRFEDAAAFKVQLLQRGHAVVQEWLRSDWDTERLPTGVKGSGPACWCA